MTTQAATQWIYDYAEATGKVPKDRQKRILGGKGAGLAEMASIGVNVPGGFTITTEACVWYSSNGGQFPPGLDEQVDAYVERLERQAGKRLGDPDDPLLVAVRSGAMISMPGMMDTVLNLGLNDRAVEGLARKSGNPRFAYDSYRRFIEMFGNVVAGVKADHFHNAMSELKRDRGVREDTALTADDLRELVDTFKAIYREHTGEDFPQDPREQLDKSIRAVFRSWDSPRAKTYRNHAGIPHDLGTAVNVVQMVFGNLGETSGTGVAFTRNPSTGVRELYGDYLINAQGEDVVAGIRNTKPLAQLEQEMPEAFSQFVDTMDQLERHYGDMQDIEFTIQEGELFLLQTRSGKRTGAAAVRIAVDFVDEGSYTREQAVASVDANLLDQLLHPQLDPQADLDVLTTGLNASPGAATGAVVFDADTADERGRAGDAVLLVRWETSPDDIHGLLAAQGVLTSHGGMTSHAAVVARGMGKPCVCGAEECDIDAEAKTLRIGDRTFGEGDVITIDGSTGRVIAGEVPLIPPQVNEHLERLLGWADEMRRLGVRTNADTPEDSRKAREFGAQGIGLCRTEHMFMAEDRLPVVRQMILAREEAERRSHLDRLLPFQREDFEGIFEAMSGLPVTIRLLDPPLHEFLPDLTQLLLEIQRREAAGEDAREQRVLADTVRSLKEQNPMLGTRGCRLGILFPEIFEMQVRAIIQAAKAVRDRGGVPVVEIMIPLVGFESELEYMRRLVVDTAEAEGTDGIEYLVGTMIELPRAALVADQIARQADFFSFGTNDLTQTTLGFSRDDAEGKFLTHYLEAGLLAANPFARLDQEGVGQLVTLGVERGRSTKPDLKTGICGEHGGDPESVKFCHGAGLDYVSCSPFRVPLARLAAAQAALADPA